MNYANEAQAEEERNSPSDGSDAKQEVDTGAARRDRQEGGPDQVGEQEARRSKVKHFAKVYANGFITIIDKDRTPVDREQLAKCKEFYALCKESSGPPTVTSYKLKHVVQKWSDMYISNGACILAALELGIKVKRFATTHPSAEIGLTKTSIKDAANPNWRKDRAALLKRFKRIR